MNTVSKKRLGFRSAALHKKKEPHAFHYLAERTSFWVAVLSLFAFVTGNMVGQHGWRVFWKSVMGQYDDSLIVYDGTIEPVEFVPNYLKWNLYGGDSTAHTYRQVPKDLLIPLPPYKPHDQLSKDDVLEQIVYSVDNFGTYKTGGGQGGHVGIDIRLPEGTPVRSIMQGIVVVTAEQPSGFGKYIIVKHPRVPNPEKPTEVITLYSLYAHLSGVFVSNGTVVQKGETIGASGMTGNASGPHLHFQVQRDVCKDGTEIGGNPFWSFTTSDMKEAGVSFAEAINTGLKREYGLQCTVNPLEYVQAHYKPVITVAENSDQETIEKTVRKRMTVAERREQRIKNRKSRRIAMELKNTAIVQLAEAPQDVPIEIIKQETVAAAAPLMITSNNVTSIDLMHDGAFSRGWEKLRIRLLDAQGSPIRSPELTSDLYLSSAYGTAEFRPETLSALDFENGEAVVQMLPRGHQTVVVQVQPGGILSSPMKYEKE